MSKNFRESTEEKFPSRNFGGQSLDSSQTDLAQTKKSKKSKKEPLADISQKDLAKLYDISKKKR